MKKSEMYTLAMLAVIACPQYKPEDKLEILKVLIEDEEVAAFCEETEA